MGADPALDLAVAYLRLNGYFLLTEQDLQVREPAGFRSLTDIDIIALRPPTALGPAHHHIGQAVEECLIVTDIDCTLDVDTTRFDVIVGDVKTAEATLNPALRTPGALHAARFIRTHLQTHHDLYRVTRFADPVVALLELLEKVE